MVKYLFVVILHSTLSDTSIWTLRKQTGKHNDGIGAVGGGGASDVYWKVIAGEDKTGRVVKKVEV